MTDVIRRCLIVDTETSDLDANAELIEVGLVLYSITNQTPLMEFSTLVPATGNKAESVNRIKPAALREIAEIGSLAADDIIQQMLASADAIISYNVEFDARFFDPSAFALDNQDWPWLCAMSDFKWPRANKQQGSLIHLALDHGIGVATAHRALTDCRLISELFDRMEDLPAMFERAMRPKALFQGLQRFDDNQLAKDAGFKWNGQAKTWSRIMAIDDAVSLPFETRKLYNVSHLASDWVTLVSQPNQTLF